MSLFIAGFNNLSDKRMTVRRGRYRKGLLKLCRKSCRKARIGIHTALPRQVLNALKVSNIRIDKISTLTSPDSASIQKLFEEMRAVQSGKGFSLTLTADVGLAPDFVHRMASMPRGHWALGVGCRPCGL